MCEPKDITKDSELDYEIASFGYYDGLDYARANNLLHTTDFKKVIAGNGYMVCCGDIMIAVKETDYPNIKRRIL